MMTESKFNEGDRSFKELTNDEKVILVGSVTRDVCLDFISTGTGMPKEAIAFFIKNKVKDVIHSLSSEQIKSIIDNVRTIKSQ